MNPYVDKFLATTRIYLQVFTGMTEALNAKDKELTKRHRALSSAILDGPYECSHCNDVKHTGYLASATS